VNTSAPTPNTIEASAHTRRWIEQFVVGQNLCPFAAPALLDQQLRITVCDTTDEAQLARAVLLELDLIQSTPAAELLTSVLVFTQALGDFDDYLDFLGLAEDLLEEAGLEGMLQIASFHPDYVFDAVPADDASHYSNRSPWPMLHFLREDQIEYALDHYPDPEQIPARNIAHLRELGADAIQALLARIEQAGG
jgi:hypothetical protein